MGVTDTLTRPRSLSVRDGESGELGGTSDKGASNQKQ